MKVISSMGGRQWALLGALVLLFGPLAHAQTFGRVEETRSNITSYHYYVLPGAATVQVQVLGAVRDPGLYEINTGVDLGKVLALAGGPILNPSEQYQRRDVTVRLFRHQGNQRSLVYEAALTQAIQEPQAYPVLQDGDVMTVEVITHEKLTWRDFLPVIGSVAAIGLAVERFSRVF